MDISKLTPDAGRLWQRLAHEPLLNGFVLIGGTALSLRIGHRVSEDLDFAYLGDLLPTLRLRQLGRILNKEGIHFELNQDIRAEQDFIDSGLLLEDHQQNYLANSTKVSFIRLDNSVTSLLSGARDSSLRVATLDEIFKTKALVCADRSKSRDWFDLYILLTRHGYEMKDLYLAFNEADRSHSYKVAEQRLRCCVPGKADEGYLYLIRPAPSLDELRTFFNAAFDQVEIELSKAAFRSVPHRSQTP
jgi:predicted nucleotidyltransferase component of viral defense system